MTAPTDTKTPAGATAASDTPERTERSLEECLGAAQLALQKHTMTLASLDDLHAAISALPSQKQRTDAVFGLKLDAYYIREVIAVKISKLIENIDWATQTYNEASAKYGTSANRIEPEHKLNIAKYREQISHWETILHAASHQADRAEVAAFARTAASQRDSIYKLHGF